MISEQDKKIIEKLKPELKRLDLSHEQVMAIGIVIKENPQALDKCIDYLKSVEPGIDGEEIATEIIDICCD